MSGLQMGQLGLGGVNSLLNGSVGLVMAVGSCDQRSKLREWIGYSSSKKRRGS